MSTWKTFHCMRKWVSLGNDHEAFLLHISEVTLESPCLINPGPPRRKRSRAEPVLKLQGSRGLITGRSCRCDQALGAILPTRNRATGSRHSSADVRRESVGCESMIFGASVTAGTGMKQLVSAFGYKCFEISGQREVNTVPRAR